MIFTTSQKQVALGYSGLIVRPGFNIMNDGIYGELE